MPSPALEFVTSRRTRLVLTWLVLLAALGHRGIQAWINFRVADRPDRYEGRTSIVVGGKWMDRPLVLDHRNDGHTSIDFGGQWLMGRLLVLGHGQELYSRSRHLEVARAGFPRDHQPSHATDNDAERLVSWYVGPEDDPVGGPLYPPIHAFVMAPFGLIADPYLSYRICQGVMLGCVLLAGLGVRYLTSGRWWWLAATAVLLIFPGCRGAIDLAQNSTISITLLIWGWGLIVRGRPTLGGILWGLLAFKPVWAVSFLAALLLLRQWRAAGAMTATSAGLVALTLPFVGIHSWFDWLHIGQLATNAYAIDRNWIFLSRDLFGVPRRMLLEFRDGRAISDPPIAAALGWALWSLVAGITVLVVRLARRRVQLVGPLPAFVLFAAWLCTYRFMYYDALIAALGVIVLLADPQPFFRRAWWPVASWASFFVGLLLVIENATAPLNVDLTASAMYYRATETAPDGSTKQTAPTVRVGSGDEYPWDTAVIFALWVWCAFAVLMPSWNRARTVVDST